MPKWIDQVSIATPAGVPPISIPSSRPTVTNLDADILDGQHGSYYLSAPNHLLPATLSTAAINVPGVQIPHVHTLGIVGDDIAFRTVTNLEYWNFSTSAWVSALTSQTNPQILLTGRPGITASLNTVAPTYRKWRFVVQCSAYLGQIMLAVHQTWNNGAHQVALTLERGPTASGAWSTMIPETLSPADENNYHFHVSSSAGQSSDAFYRVTVESKDAVNSTSYTGLQLLFTYTRNGMPGGQTTPFFWDHLKTVYFSGRIISTLATGTSPFAVTSTTVVSNLNADTVDGQHAAAFATASHAHDWASITGKPSSFTPSAHATSHQPGQPDFLALDHSWLFGLGNDDHPHYLNNARGDARYLGLSGGTVSGAITVPALYSPAGILEMRDRINISARGGGSDYFQIDSGPGGAGLFSTGEFTITATSLALFGPTLFQWGISFGGGAYINLPSSAPVSPSSGSAYFASDRLYVYNGSAWKSVLLT